MADESDNEPEDYGDSSDGEKEEVYEEVYEPGPRSSARTKKKQSKFDRIVKATRAEQAMRRSDDRFMEQIRAANLEKPLPLAETKRQRKRRRLADQMFPEPLGEPIGFDEDTLQDRIARSKAKEFKVERVVGLIHNRFVPFGAPGFYSNTAQFYCQPTDLCCMWCTEPFDGPPLPLAYKYKERSASDFVFRVSGQFCSPSCMLAKARTQLRSLAIPKLMLKKVYGINISAHIEPAPPPETLRKYGGMYTIRQFRATGATGVKTSVIHPPFLPLSAGITEIEKTDTIVTEVGGKELAQRRICVRGSNFCATNTPFHRYDTNHKKQGRFVCAPTVEDQIKQSDERLRLQRGGAATGHSKQSILSFMNLKK